MPNKRLIVQYCLFLVIFKSEEEHLEKQGVKEITETALHSKIGPCTRAVDFHQDSFAPERTFVNI